MRIEYLVKNNAKIKQSKKDIVKHNCCLLTLVLLLILPSLRDVKADVKVAFIGDQGVGSNALSVLQLVADEGVDLLLIQGDFGYAPNTAMLWESNLNQTLGPDFPVLGVVGNHENFEWDIYKNLLIERMNRIERLSCVGDYGVKAMCSFADLTIVQVAAGIDEVSGVNGDDNYGDYIDQSLSDHPSIWRICSWHKNQKLMQVGGKGDETGWAAYEACLAHGAIVATGHEHSYSRTFLMSDFENQVVVHNDNHLELNRGQSFAFVSGLGGKGIREQKLTGDWWASVYTSDQSATFGVLFCSFALRDADCYFKTISGGVVDSFSLTSNLAKTEASDNNQPPSNHNTDVSGEDESTMVENNKGGSGSLNSAIMALLLCFGLGRFYRCSSELPVA